MNAKTITFLKNCRFLNEKKGAERCCFGSCDRLTTTAEKLSCRDESKKKKKKKTKTKMRC